MLLNGIECSTNLLEAIGFCIFRSQKLMRMRNFTLLLSVLFLSASALAQSTEGTASYNKKTYPATISELPYPPDVVETAVKQEMKKRGYSGKNNKGYTEYKGVRLKELGSESVDLYMKTERKGRKDKDATILTILTAKGAENFIGRSADGALAEGVKQFANNLHPLAGDHALELEIGSQEELIRKAERKFQGLQSDSVALEKKKLQLEQNMAENKTAIQKQAEEVEMQRKVLETLRTKRRKEND